MAIAYDTSTKGGDSVLTWSHTCTGTNLVLFVCVTNLTGSTGTGVTYGGYKLSQLTPDSTGGVDFTSVYILQNPPTGANTIVITGPSGGFGYAGSAISYSGVYVWSTPTSSVKYTAGAVTVTVNVDVPKPNSWVVGFASSTAGSGVAGLSTTRTDRQGTAIPNSTFSDGYNLISDSNGIVAQGTQGIAYTAVTTSPSVTGAYVISISPDTIPSFRTRQMRPALFKPGNSK